MIAIVHLEVRLLVEAPLWGSPKRSKKVGSEIGNLNTQKCLFAKKMLHVMLGTAYLYLHFDSVDDFDEVAGVHEIPCLKFDDTSRNSHKCGPRKASH